MDASHVTTGVGVIEDCIAVAIKALDVSDMVVPDGDVTRRWMSARKLVPIRGQEKVSDWLAENPDADPAATEGSSGAA